MIEQALFIKLLCLVSAAYWGIDGLVVGGL